jgi:hypothetical protein
MSAIGQELQDYFLPYLDHHPAQFRRGETAVPALRYLIVSMYPAGVRIIPEPKDNAQVDALIEAVTAKFEGYAGMRSFATQGSTITSNDGGTCSINLHIAGHHLAGISDAALAAYRRVKAVFGNPRIQADPPTLPLSQPLVEIRPDWERAAELGMSAGNIGFPVAALTAGAFVDEFFLADDKIDIYLYSHRGPGATLEGLTDLPVHTPGGVLVPLSSLARVVETVDTSTVRRVDARRTVSLNIILPESAVPTKNHIRIGEAGICTEVGVGVGRARPTNWRLNPLRGQIGQRAPSELEDRMLCGEHGRKGNGGASGAARGAGRCPQAARRYS